MGGSTQRYIRINLIACVTANIYSRRACTANFHLSFVCVTQQTSIHGVRHAGFRCCTIPRTQIPPFHPSTLGLAARAWRVRQIDRQMGRSGKVTAPSPSKMFSPSPLSPSLQEYIRIDGGEHSTIHQNQSDCVRHSKHLFTACVYGQLPSIFCVRHTANIYSRRASRWLSVLHYSAHADSTLPPFHPWSGGEGLEGQTDGQTDGSVWQSHSALSLKNIFSSPPLSLALSLSSRIHKNRWGSTQEYIRIKDGLPLYSLSLQEYIRIDGGVTSESKMVSLSLQEYIRIDEEGALNNTSESKMVSLSLQEYIRIDGGTWGASGSKRSLRCRSVGGEEKKRNLSQQLPRLCQTGPSVCPSVGGVRREKISASSCHGFARSAHLSVHLSETQ